MPRYSLNRYLGKLATENAERQDKAKAKQDAIPKLPDPDRWQDMKSAQPQSPKPPT